jgi:serine/threonine protein kinase
MELIEGQKLKGPLPIKTALEYANQILDALDAAHRKGLTHRPIADDLDIDLGGFRVKWRAGVPC